MMNVKPIRTEQDYEAALRAVEPFFDNEPATDTPEGDFFEVMCLLIAEYEKKHYADRGDQVSHGAAGADRQRSGAGDW